MPELPVPHDREWIIPGQYEEQLVEGPLTQADFFRAVSPLLSDLNLHFFDTSHDTSTTQHATFKDLFAEEISLKASLGDAVILTGRSSLPPRLSDVSHFRERLRHAIAIVEFQSGDKDLTAATAQLILTLRVQHSTLSFRLPMFGIAIGTTTISEKPVWKLRVIKLEESADVTNGLFDATPSNFCTLLSNLRDLAQQSRLGEL